MDYQTFNTLTKAIINATPDQLDAAIKECAEVANCHTYKPARRLIFRAFANMLRLYRRKYARVRQYASKAEQGFCHDGTHQHGAGLCKTCEE